MGSGTGSIFGNRKMSSSVRSSESPRVDEGPRQCRMARKKLVLPILLGPTIVFRPGRSSVSSLARFLKLRTEIRWRYIVGGPVSQLDYTYSRYIMPWFSRRLATLLEA